MVSLVYDLEKNAPTLSIDAHREDTNSVCWADKASKHILCSASDDGYVKIWFVPSCVEGALRIRLTRLFCSRPSTGIAGV